MTSNRQMAAFTLLESLVTIMVVGLGVVAIMGAQQAFHRQSDVAQRTGSGMLLANEVRELMLPLPNHDPVTGTTIIGIEPGETSVAAYDDVDDFAGVTFDPPITALRDAVPNMTNWSQAVTVEAVNADNLAATGLTVGTTDLMRVMVTVQYQQQTVAQLTWITQ